jgi:hypothetical protein
MPAKDVGPILERWGMFFPFGDRNTAERFPVVHLQPGGRQPHRVRGLLLFVFFEHEGAFLYINWAFVPGAIWLHWAVRDAFRTERGS